MAPETSIRVHVPGELRGCCNGASEVSVSAQTVRGALEELERCYPSFHRSVCDETGKLRRHINLFVNNLHMSERQGLDTALESSDSITILPAVSGG